MKLLRVGEFNQEIVATLDKENKLRDLSSYIKDLNPSTFNEDNLKIWLFAPLEAISISIISSLRILHDAVLSFLKSKVI